MDVDRQLYKTNRLDGAKLECAHVFDAMVELQRVSYKARIDHTNLEAVFSAFEMARLLKTLGTLNVEQIELLTGSLTKVIEATLQATITYPLEWDKRVETPHRYDVKLHKEYAALARLVNDLHQQHGTQSVAILTFNYDLCLDFAFECEGVDVDQVWSSEPKNKIQYLKLIDHAVAH